jgi:ADP-heptose:LPS heptosyltransferase
MSLLVLRTSSMGDVIMTLPVIRAFVSTYPGEEIVFVTKKPFDLFLNDIPDVKVIIAHHHDRHKGLSGLLRLFREIKKEYKITAVIDLHDVMRSKVIRILFGLSGCRVAKIDKGRIEKRKLIKGKFRNSLKHTVTRYAETFERAGYPLKMTGGPWLKPSQEALNSIESYIPVISTRLVGVAPIAKHELKTWPAEKMISFLHGLSSSSDITIFLFGSPDEASKLDELAKKVPGCINIAGRIRLAQEIALISKLDLMIAMDSSNMHLAAMLGIKTLSIWGATHPWAGFSAWGSEPGDMIQIPVEELTCRPCTIYGKGTCRRGDLACLNRINSMIVMEKTHSILDIKK